MKKIPILMLIVTLSILIVACNKIDINLKDNKSKRIDTFNIYVDLYNTIIDFENTSLKPYLESMTQDDDAEKVANSQDDITDSAEQLPELFELIEKDKEFPNLKEKALAMQDDLMSIVNSIQENYDYIRTKQHLDDEGETGIEIYNMISSHIDSFNAKYEEFSNEFDITEKQIRDESIASLEEEGLLLRYNINLFIITVDNILDKLLEEGYNSDTLHNANYEEYESYFVEISNYYDNAYNHKSNSIEEGFSDIFETEGMLEVENILKQINLVENRIKNNESLEYTDQPYYTVDATFEKIFVIYDKFISIYNK